MSEVSKSDLVLVEKYVFLGKTRYRIALSGTNIVFNVEASSDEEAYNKVLEIVRKMGIDRSLLESIRAKVKKS
ncbi:hypothetical protein TCELL_0233 [Thermogladius calderae 1633]|uniref:Uncharacterized protein n=1 Tax=Thermogladius calderae (strain DSM 22663 / VKM B-2946 / 1633) TaxID=1184251 RepID=I3TD20_THEC1|nr:hypothetical protein TCELL_0233 [Thermogladius calderae 1633]